MRQRTAAIGEVKAHRFWTFGAALLLGLTLMDTAAAQVRVDEEFALPTYEANWVNSPPISSEALKGKAAFLWFYEESCPNCRRRWPDLYALANKYQGQPIVFMAVNSGTSRGMVQQYAREVRLPWPIIVDPTREFERMAGVGELSLQNVTQVGIITADGQFHRGSYSDPESSVERALRGASWKVSPDEVPPALKNAWLAVEFGNYPAAASLIKRSLNSPKPELKQAATALNEAVLGLAEKQLEQAHSAEEAGKNWEAYKQYQQVGNQFAGYELPEDVKAKLDELEDNEQVKQEQAAFKSLGLIERTLASNSPAGRRGAPIRLKKLIEDYPGTEAASQAEKWLGQLGAE